MSEGVQSERRLMKRRRMRPGIVRRRVTAAASVIGTKTVPIPIAISMMLGRTWPTYDDETSSNECTGRNLRHQTADDLRDHDDRRADPQEREACLDRGQPITFCTYCVRKKNIANTAAPTISITA